MKKLLLVSALLFILSSCSYVQIRKMDVEQGNVINEIDLKKIHVGMTQDQVQSLLGPTLVMNTFSNDRIDYVYTYKPGYGHVKETYVTLEFSQGRLIDIKKNAK